MLAIYSITIEIYNYNKQLGGLSWKKNGKNSESRFTIRQEIVRFVLDVN